jgi:hypothetical protein
VETFFHSIHKLLALESYKPFYSIVLNCWHLSNQVEYLKNTHSQEGMKTKTDEKRGGIIYCLST